MKALRLMTSCGANLAYLNIRLIKGQLIIKFHRTKKSNWLALLNLVPAFEKFQSDQ